MTVAILGSAADAWSRRAPFDYKKMALQLAECSGPAFLMAAATLLVAEARMCERDPSSTCAVERRDFPVGDKPTRQLSLRPVAIGAVVEVTKRLKPSV